MGWLFTQGQRAAAEVTSAPKTEAVPARSHEACCPGRCSPGIQEFVEAASFLHYIRHRSLVSLEEINARLVFVGPEEPASTVSARA